MRYRKDHSALIIGAGGVGLGFASALIAAGVKVSLVARGNKAEVLQHNGLTRDGTLGTYHAPAGSFIVRQSIRHVVRQAYDSIFVCAKSYDSEAIADQLATTSGLLDDSTSVVLCQNGWGNAEIFASRIGPDRVLNARIMSGFQTPRHALVRVTVHANEVRIGSLFNKNANVSDTCAMLTEGGLPTLPSPDISRDLWDKMLFNSTVNPLGAITNATIGELAASAAMSPILEALVSEFYDAMQAAGYSTHSPSPEVYLKKLNQEIFPATASHRPSMVFDLEAGRRTEIDALNGVIVRLGDFHGLNVETHRCILAMVSFLSSRHRLSLAG